MEIKNILKNNFRLHDIELLNNEVDLDEDLYSRHGKFEEVKEEIDASSEDIEFNARRGFASGHFSPPSYHYEQHAYHPCHHDHEKTVHLPSRLRIQQATREEYQRR